MTEQFTGKTSATNAKGRPIGTTSSCFVPAVVFILRPAPVKRRRRNEKPSTSKNEMEEIQDNGLRS